MHPLTAWRKRKKMTQADLSNDPSVDINQGNLSKIERGIVYPSPAALKRLCKRTGLSADAFLNYQPSSFMDESK